MRKFKRINPILLSSHDQEDNDNNDIESGLDSPPPSSLVGEHTKASTSTSSPKKSKRGMHKRVISVPIKDIDATRLKGENTPPPSDAWTWRKYGQKPIKGSPYPRGYYRCSSAKGCPAKKQVERSRSDPTMLVVTYSCDHNHPWPLPSKHHHSKPRITKTEIVTRPETPEPESELPEQEQEPEPDQENLITGLDHEDFSWLGDTSSTILESPIFDTDFDSSDVDMFLPMGEDEESLFADLGELPECSTVFRQQRGVGPQVQIC